MDSEEMNNFFVTLPSNSSASYFPDNTQSSFRTKLSSPLRLDPSYECGLSEIVIPRFWFNINEHNNQYSVTYKTEHWLKTKYEKHRIELVYTAEMTLFQFCESINNAIGAVLSDKASVILIPKEATSEVNVVVNPNFEIDIKKADGSKLLYMLHQTSQDKIIDSTRTYKFRPSKEYPLKIVFHVFNRNPKSVNTRMISNVAIKDDSDNELKTVTDVIRAFNYNLNIFELNDYVHFSFDAVKMEITFDVAEFSEVVFTKESAPLFMKKLYKNDDKLVISGKQTFKMDPRVKFQLGEAFDLRIYEYYQTLEIETRIEELNLNIGFYDSPQKFFKSFKYIHFEHLPDQKVMMIVPKNYEISFVKGLADMMGFENTHFSEGVHFSKYPLELDAGITEVFVYTDVISNQFVGDTLSPLLRIIPCMTEKSDQIVKTYQRPLYFPLRKHFIETIQIDLKTSSGNNIVFSGGKTYVVLSFRRRKMV